MKNEPKDLPIFLIHLAVLESVVWNKLRHSESAEPKLGLVTRVGSPGNYSRSTWKILDSLVKYSEIKSLMVDGGFYYKDGKLADGTIVKAPRK